MEGRELPVGWVAEGLGSVVSLRTGRFGSSLHKTDYVEGATPVVNPMHIIKGRIVADFKTTVGTDVLDRLKEFRLEEGDVVMGRRGEMGRAAVARNQETGWLCGTGSLVLRQLGSLDPDFLQRFLSSPSVVMTLESASVGSTMVNLNQGILRELEIPVPPLNEQRRIAAKLDTTLAAVEACRQRLDGVAAILKRFRQAVLAAATTGDLTREWREERGKSLDAWSARTVGDVVTDIEAGLNVQCEERPPADNEKGLVKISAVTWGTYDEDESKTLKPGQKVLERNRIRPGDFLISRANTIELVGSCVIVHEARRALYLSDKVLRLVMPEEWKRWLLMCLRSENGRRQIEGLSSGNQLSMRNLSQKNLLSIMILLPPKDELGQIEGYSNSLFALADQLEARLTAARKIVDRLTPALLAKAFRGELVPQDPNDEPASVLLERIRAARQAEAAAGKPSRRGRRKAAASPEQAPPTAAPAPADLLAQLLQECGALSERALLAASELDPAGFRAQLALEQGMGAIRETAQDGQVLLEAVG